MINNNKFIHLPSMLKCILRGFSGGLPGTPAEEESGFMWSDLAIIALLGLGAVATAILCFTLRNLVRSVVAFALSSAFLAGIFYLLASPYAAALELTVGAGLVAVLFLAAILLAGGEELEAPS